MKLRILLSLLAFLFVGQLRGAFSLVAHTIAGSSTGTNVTTSAINTTGANLIIVTVAQSGAVDPVSDSNGNTWTQLLASSGSNKSTLLYCFNPTVGVGHTFTATGGGFPAIGVQAWSGAATSPFDVQNTNFSTTAVTSLQPGSVTPGSSNELIISGLMWTFDGVTGLSIDSGFTISDQTPHVSGQHFGAGIAYFVQSAAGAIDPTWSWTTASNSVTSIASFKAASTPSIPTAGVAWHQRLTFVPNSTTVVTNQDSLIGHLHLTNSGSTTAHIVLTDNSTNCNGAGCQFWPTISIAPNTSYDVDFGGMLCTGGIKWSASAANAVVGYIRGFYTLPILARLWGAQ
jgi:hypothetical protein